MDLFTRKMRLFCVSNIMVSFVCTGFIGINGTSIGPTENANEISLIASDTEPVSQNGEGEANFFAFALEGVEIIIKQQEEIINNQQVVNSIIAKSDTTKKATKTVTNGTKKKVTNVVSKKEVKNTTTYASARYSSVTGDAIVSYAKRYLGLRYKTGTPSLTNGSDCSGFTMLIYREFGVSLSRTVGGQISQGSYVNKKDLQKGDLVFYKAKGSRGGASHVGIYIGGGQVIHESRPGVGVKISSVNMMQYVTARRVINNKAKQIAEQKLEEEKKNEVITDNSSNVDATNNTDIANTTTNNENNVVNSNENIVNNENNVASNNVSETVSGDNSNNEVTVKEETTEIKQEELKQEIKEEPKQETSEESISQP